MPWKFVPRPFAETDEALKNPARYRTQWMIVRNVVMAKKGMSRRKLKDEMSLVFAHAGHAVFPFRNGGRYLLPDIDDVFGKDPDMRSLSHYLEADDSGLHPRRMSRKPERLRVINLYLKLKYPRFIRHLERRPSVDGPEPRRPLFPGSGRSRS